VLTCLLTIARVQGLLCPSKDRLAFQTIPRVCRGAGHIAAARPIGPCIRAAHLHMAATERHVKVRSVTAFVHLSRDACLTVDTLRSALAPAVEHNAAMQKRLEAAGFEVQTTRIATNSFEDYFDLSVDAPASPQVKALATVLKDLDINFFNLGPARSLHAIDRLPDLLMLLPTASASCDLLPSRALGDLCHLRARRAAAACRRIASESPGGSGNFRFCASANVDPGIPFYPAAYHASATGASAPPPAFAIAFENGELVYDELAAGEGRGGGELPAAMERLENRLSNVYIEVEDIARRVSEETGLEYLGIDTSLNPSLADGTVGSLVHAAEALVGNGFVWGGAGTLRVSEALTRAVKKCRVKQVGYCGLMLPVLEDRGLAARCAQGMSSVQSLLACSAVCGVGLDTVPLSGLVSEEALANTYLDVAALAHRLHKPLSCRLFPVPGAKAGEAVAFPDNPYLCDSCALALP
jgi:uncharacterized protein (UPF0210 family)